MNSTEQTQIPSPIATDIDDDGATPVVFLDSDEMVMEDPGAAGCDEEQLPDEADDGDEEAAGGEVRAYADDSVRCVAHGAPVYAVALSPFDEDLLATGGGDDGVLLWRASGRGAAPLRALGSFEDSVAALAFSHDGTFLAAGAMDATCKARPARLVRPLSARPSSVQGENGRRVRRHAMRIYASALGAKAGRRVSAGRRESARARGRQRPIEKARACERVCACLCACVRACARACV